MKTDQNNPSTQPANEPAVTADPPAPPSSVKDGRVLASSPLIVSLLIVLLVAFLVQGALLTMFVLNDSKAHQAEAELIEAKPALVAKVSDELAEEPSSAAATPAPLRAAPQGTAALDDFFSDDWQPFAEMARMREEMDRLFDDSFDRFRLLPGFDDAWLDAGTGLQGDATIREVDGNYVVDLEIPGADEATLDITLENGLLSISGSREEVDEQRDANGNVVRRSQSTSRFQRAFSLPGEVDESGMKTKFNDGVLTITVPKK